MGVSYSIYHIVHVYIARLKWHFPDAPFSSPESCFPIVSIFHHTATHLLPTLFLQFQHLTNSSLESRLEPRPPPLTPQPLLLQSLSLMELLRVVLVPHLLVPAHPLQHANSHGRRRRRRRGETILDEDGAAGDGLGADLGPLEGVADVERLAPGGRSCGDDFGNIEVEGAGGGVGGVVGEFGL